MVKSCRFYLSCSISSGLGDVIYFSASNIASLSIAYSLGFDNECLNF